MINDNGSVVGVASIAGIAGNVGQTNYATSKAGRDRPGRLAGRTSWTAASPSTPSRRASSSPQMTAAVPFATREVGQRLNAMSQGGLPVDVAETIAWYASPAPRPSTATWSASAAR